jgi:hypothetical protein
VRGGTGSHTLPNYVTRKQTINATLVRGHHAQTWRTARNFLNFIDDSNMPNKTVHYYFLTGEDDIARFDSRQYTVKSKNTKKSRKMTAKTCFLIEAHQLRSNKLSKTIWSVSGTENVNSVISKRSHHSTALWVRCFLHFSGCSL